MKLSLALVGLAAADLLPPLGGDCPRITCVMFCKNGMQKDAKGCDICSCARDGKIATGTASCKRDADGCCSELGVAWCADQNMCVSTHNPVIPCKTWAANVPAAAANAQITVLTNGVIQSTTFGQSAPAQATAPIEPSAPRFTPSQSFSSPFPGTFAQSGYVNNVGNAPLTNWGLSVATANASVMATGNVGNVGNVVNAPPLVNWPVANASLTAPGLRKPFCSPVMCMMYCPQGMQKDANGCEICACAGATPNACPSTADCAGRACPGGYAKDSKGCPTCICHAGSAPVTSVGGRVSSSQVASGRPSSAQIEAGAHSDALVALDRPSIAQNPCAAHPCNRLTERCVVAPKQCVTTPCPQHKCVKRRTNMKAGRRP